MADNGSERPLLAASAFLCLAAVAFGGASAGAPLRLAVVELCALPALTLALLGAARDRRVDWGVGVLTLIVGTPLLQLVLLPPSVWRHLAASAERSDALAAAGVALGWAPLSLFPAATLDCLLALIAPAAIFLATTQLTSRGRRRLAGLWLASASAGLVLGMVQLSQPDGGWAYLYVPTNPGSLVGLFANRNHQAAWLLALIPISAGLAAPELLASDSRKRAAAIAIGALAPILAIVALAAVRSRAGVLLAAPAAVGALAVLAGSRLPRRTLAILAIAPLIAGAAVAAFASGPVLDRFADQPRLEARAETWPAVVDAGRGVMPLGSGVGSFDRVFRAAEPLGLVGPTFLNHAHNDYLEVWIETGLVGALVLAAFLVWFGLRVARAWSPSGSRLARASSVSAGLLMAASAVDYPLRTETLACLFAYACGCLVPSRTAAESAA
ncbi:MAG: O-antigen ligase family protein [Caulobacteraceae bacterium]|nr:O-antigen ligase family protein [Caulobacteraceae bacterium]